MTVWAIANQKGGVGKTTTTITLAGILSQRGKRCLIIDADPHGSLSVYLGLDPDTTENSLYNLFHDYDGLSRDVVNDTIVETKFSDIHLLPASGAMAVLDRQMGTKSGMGLVLKSILNLIATDYDYFLIDCPPQLGLLMVNALAVCDELLVPVQTEFLALKGLDRMMHTLKMITHSRSSELKHTIIPTMYDRRTKASRRALEVLQDQFAEHLWNGIIPVDTQFREASRSGTPLSLIAPKTRGVIAYASLLDYLIGEEEFVQSLGQL